MRLVSNIKQSEKIPSNSPIDELLGGGIEKGSVTQFYGPPGVGKTNLVLNIAVSAAKKSKIVYIDTEGGLSIERIKQLSGDQFNEIAQNIIVFEPTNSQELHANLNTIRSWIINHEQEISLIILDSAVALYRITEGTSKQVNKEFGIQMALLADIARKFNIAVAITNQVYSVIDEEKTEAIAPVGGFILKYKSKYTIELEKDELTLERIATLHRHKTKKEGQTVKFTITNKGLE